MIRKTSLCLWATAVTFTLLLSACTLGPGTPTPQPTDSIVPSPPPTLTLELTPTATATPQPISFAPDAYTGWLSYTNAKYKFTILHPPDWNRREIQGVQNTMSGHAVYIEPRSPSLVRLVVGFKRATEEAQITRTGVGSGEIVQRGSVAFLGQPISRDMLVLNGKDLAILYQGSGEIRRGGLVFTVSFDYRGNPTDKSALTLELETMADMIVASFELIG